MEKRGGYPIIQEKRSMNGRFNKLYLSALVQRLHNYHPTEPIFLEKIDQGFVLYSTPRRRNRLPLEDLGFALVQGKYIPASLLSLQ